MLWSLRIKETANLLKSGIYFFLGLGSFTVWTSDWEYKVCGRRECDRDKEASRFLCPEMLSLGCKCTSEPLLLGHGSWRRFGLMKWKFPPYGLDDRRNPKEWNFSFFLRRTDYISLLPEPELSSGRSVYLAQTTKRNRNTRTLALLQDRYPLCYPSWLDPESTLGLYPSMVPTFGSTATFPVHTGRLSTCCVSTVGVFSGVDTLPRHRRLASDHS